MSRFATLLILYNLVGFGALVVYQLNTSWYFSTSNIALGPDPSLANTTVATGATGAGADAGTQAAVIIDWSRIVTLVVHAPLAEELVFRAGMFYVALSRCVSAAAGRPTCARHMAPPVSLTRVHRRSPAGAKTLFGVPRSPAVCLRASTCSTR